VARDAAGGVTGVEEDEGRQLALLQASGPRVEDSGLGHITDVSWSAPYEDLKPQEQMIVPQTLKTGLHSARSFAQRGRRVAEA